jgi:hypothetical protein
VVFKKHFSSELKVAKGYLVGETPLILIWDGKVYDMGVGVGFGEETVVVRMSGYESDCVLLVVEKGDGCQLSLFRIANMN